MNKPNEYLNQMVEKFGRQAEFDGFPEGIKVEFHIYMINRVDPDTYLYTSRAKLHGLLIQEFTDLRSYRSIIELFESMVKSSIRAGIEEGWCEIMIVGTMDAPLWVPDKCNTTIWVNDNLDHDLIKRYNDL